MVTRRDELVRVDRSDTDSSVIIDLVGVEPDQVRGWTRVVGAYGAFEMTLVRSGTSFSRALYEHVAGDSDAATRGIGAHTDLWQTVTGNQRRDWYITGPSEESLRQYLADARRADPRLAVPADARIVYEALTSPAADGLLPAQPTAFRTYVVDRQARITHRHIDGARVDSRTVSGAPEVLVSLTPPGRVEFAALTRDNVGRKLAILLDGRVSSAPVIQSAITGGQMSITMGAGPSPHAEARALAAALRQGTLSSPVALASVTRVAPTVSESSLLAARLVFALPFALLVLVLSLVVSRLTPGIDPEVSYARAPRAVIRLLRRAAVTGAAMAAAALLVQVPLPGVDSAIMRVGTADPGGLSLVSLGLMPLISAFLLVELVALAVPRWRGLRTSGTRGRRRLGYAAAVLTLGLAVAQSHFIARWLSDLHDMFNLPRDATISLLAPTIAGLVGGLAILVALAQLVSRHGLGNGYVAVLLGLLGREVWNLITGAVSAQLSASALAWLVLFVAAVVAVVASLLRTTIHGKGPGPALRLPTCGVVPLVWSNAVFAAVGVVATMGFQVPHLRLLLDSNGAIAWPVFLAVTAGLAVVLSALWSRPIRFRSGARVVSPKPVAPLGQRSFWWATAVSAGGLLALAALAAVTTNTAAVVPPTVLWIAVVTAGLMDVVADARARRRCPDLVAVWPLHRVQMTPVAVEVLTAHGIDAHAQGLYFRSLFFFFAPFAPIRLMVPSHRADEARHVLRSLLAPGAEPDPAPCEPA